LAEAAGSNQFFGKTKNAEVLRAAGGKRGKDLP
jgi:hypothetical protein